MPTYKGNVGNLVQHWTLCKLLDIAVRYFRGLNFIDAHAMAPWATECPNPDPTFMGVRQGLPNGQSVYEQAWHQLAEREQEQGKGYPNSANFVQHIWNRWNRRFSLLLCEIDDPTVEQLGRWREVVDRSDGCTHTELFPRSWRTRFRFPGGLPGPRQVRLPPDKSVTLMSFDLYKYECNRLYNDPNRANRGNPGYLYRDDVERALDALEGVEGGIVIQLSTYSNIPDNPQDRVVASVNEILVDRGNFNPPVVVVLDEKMMSLIYTRCVPDALATELANLSDDFNEWRPR